MKPPTSETMRAAVLRALEAAEGHSPTARVGRYRFPSIKAAEEFIAGLPEGTRWRQEPRWSPGGSWCYDVLISDAFKRDLSASTPSPSLGVAPPPPRPADGSAALPDGTASDPH